MIAKTRAAALIGVDAVEVQIEASVGHGLAKFSIIGLADGVLKESKDRIRCAIQSAGFEFPKSDVVVSLAPASVPKSGAGYDLGIALSLLAASGQIPTDKLEQVLIHAELSLDGRTRSTAGVLALSELALKRKCKAIVVAPCPEDALSLIPSSLRVYSVASLAACVSLFHQPEWPDNWQSVRRPIAIPQTSRLELSEVRGQERAKRALSLAAAGGHNLLLVGPPGSGKSMLAERMGSILPPLTENEVCEVNRIHDAASQNGNGPKRIRLERPFRAPHHSTSVAGICGGGPRLSPGELSLAHRGVLFLDELPEFRRDVLESLRQPLESRKLTICRAGYSITFPAEFILVAAMNPCPCGCSGEEGSYCKCSEAKKHRYRAKVSGPLLDRFDLVVWVAKPKADELISPSRGAGSSGIRERVVATRALQRERFGRSEVLNATCASDFLTNELSSDEESRALLKQAVSRHALSGRGIHRVLRVARTIADMEGRRATTVADIAEALSYRIELSIPWLV